MSLRCQVHRLMPRAAIERFQEWVYHTNHPIEALIADDYFASVAGRLLKGDVIEAYAVGAVRAQHLKLLISRSDKRTVAVAPFVPSYDIDGFQVAAAPLQKPVGTHGSSDTRSRLELRHLRHGSYRIVKGDGDVVVGDIKGHAFGVDLFGRIQEGKISIEGARREVEKANLNALGHAEYLGQRSV
ncbi:MAG: hypothetical protein GKS00_21920 [Alphaproteobacteria bacterium]|nr:hypothetical protein [Alphaproteobacteria bacterium]